MFITQDASTTRSSGTSARRFGAARLRVHSSSTGTMLERISSGENLLGYNVLGSYALVRAKKDPSHRRRAARRTTRWCCRASMFIGKSAKNPNAAKLWTDYILSQRGQTHHRQRGRAVRDPHRRRGRDHAARLDQAARADDVKPIPVSTGPCCDYLDQTKRLDFLNTGRNAARSKGSRRRPARLSNRRAAIDPHAYMSLPGARSRATAPPHCLPPAASRLNWPRGVVVADRARGLPAARADLLPEPARRAVLHAATRRSASDAFGFIFADPDFWDRLHELAGASPPAWR